MQDRRGNGNTDPDEPGASRSPNQDADDAEVAALITQLSEPDWATRQAAADSLRQLGKRAHAALPHLHATLSDDDYDVREHALSALSEIESNEEALLHALARAAQDSMTNVRAAAATHLGKLQEQQEGAAQALWLRLATDDSPDVRKSAALAIAELVDSAVLARTALEKLKARDPEGVRAGIGALLHADLKALSLDEVAQEVRAALRVVPDSAPPDEIAELLYRCGPSQWQDFVTDDQSDPGQRLRVLLSDATMPVAANLLAARRDDVIRLLVTGLDDGSSGTYERAIRFIADHDLVSELDEQARDRLEALAVIMGSHGIGLNYLPLFRDPSQLLRHILESTDLDLTAMLVTENRDVLERYWEALGGSVVQDFLLAALDHPWYLAIEGAADFVRLHGRELLVGNEDVRRKFEDKLDRLMTRVPADIGRTVTLARTELRQVGRSRQLVEVVKVLRQGDDSARSEIANQIVQRPTPEAARVLVREMALWVATGAGQVVELIAETIRGSSDMVLPLLDQWEQGLEVDDHVRDRLLDAIVPSDLRATVGVIFHGEQGQKVDPAARQEILLWLAERSVDGATESLLSDDAKNKRAVDQQIINTVDTMLAEECQARALLVRQRLARLLADMSDDRFFDDQASYERIRQQLQRHAVRILGRRLATEQDITTRESIARTLANLGGREAVDVITRALVDDERTKANRQDLLARYYLEPSKTRSDEVAAILHGVVEEAKRTLRLLQVLNTAFFVAALVLIGVGAYLLLQGDGAAELLTGGVAGLSGIVGLVLQVYREPLVRIQDSVTRLVQVETAFASFIWQLNLNGTYIQSQYVAEGRLEDEHIRHTVGRIENAMHLAMDLVARYAAEGGVARIPRLTGVFPQSATPGDVIVLRGSSLKPLKSNGGRSGIVAVNHQPITPANVAWQEDAIEFTWPLDHDLSGEGPILWVNAVIDGVETNALPIQVSHTERARVASSR